jgi:hypothetical protein
MRGLDTSDEIARIQRQILASKTGEERTAMVVEMSDLVHRTLIEGIRRRSPGISERELQIQVIERWHGPEAANAVAAIERPDDTA